MLRCAGNYINLLLYQAVTLVRFNMQFLAMSCELGFQGQVNYHRLKALSWSAWLTDAQGTHTLLAHGEELMRFPISAPLLHLPLCFPLSSAPVSGGEGSLVSRFAETRIFLDWVTSVAGSLPQVLLPQYLHSAKGVPGSQRRWSLALHTCCYQGSSSIPQGPREGKGLALHTSCHRCPSSIPRWWCYSVWCPWRAISCIPVRMHLTWSLCGLVRALETPGLGGSTVCGCTQTACDILFLCPGVSDQFAFPCLLSESFSGCLLCHFQGLYLSLSGERMEEKVSMSIYF